jgi:hypothetical protein
VSGATVAVAGADAVAARWEEVLGASPAAAGVHVVEDESDRGPVEVVLAGAERGPLEIGGVRFRFEPGQDL